MTPLQGQLCTQIAGSGALVHIRPVKPKGGVVVTCPHSGRFYPPQLLAASKLDPIMLRRSEDAFVDLLLQDAPALGADLLVNGCARAFVDVNRAASDLDCDVILDVLPEEAAKASPAVRAGLGVVPRTLGEGIAIYKHKIPRWEALARLAEIYVPWHNAVNAALLAAKARAGAALLLDCHSMPSNAAGSPVCDIVLGDCFGQSCAPAVMQEASAYLRAAGLKVGRNNPYAGGYATQTYGQVQCQQHALQIEINRSLYMVEGAMALKPESAAIRAIMAGLIAHMVAASQVLAPHPEVLNLG
jgi:N-formylglutamate amidohydrolase